MISCTINYPIWVMMQIRYPSRRPNKKFNKYTVHIKPVSGKFYRFTVFAAIPYQVSALSILLLVIERYITFSKGWAIGIRHLFLIIILMYVYGFGSHYIFYVDSDDIEQVHIEIMKAQVAPLSCSACK